MRRPLSLDSLAALCGTAALVAAQPAQAFDPWRGDRADGTYAQTRSEVLARHGIVATSHPLAAQAGLDVLKAGGNAFDAVVAAAAVLNVVEPASSGIGGDAFMIAWSAKEQRLIALDASGRAVSGATPQVLRELGFSRMPTSGIHSVTAPGAVDGWDAILKRAGTRSFQELLEPAARIAEEGHAVTDRAHFDWTGAVKTLQADPDSAAVYLPGGKAPDRGTVFRNPDLARAFRALQRGGRSAFYEGEIASAILAKSQALGGALTAQDLARTRATWVEPITTNYHGYDIFQMPAPTQGMAALETLNIVEVCGPKLGLDPVRLGPRSPLYWHLLVEAKKLAYTDLAAHAADPAFVEVPVERLISKAYAATLCDRIDPARATPLAPAAEPSGGTSYIAAADSQGNMVSFIYSVFGYMGSGVTVPGYGFLLHNRGGLFTLDEASPNVIAPGKRPFNTLIPGFVMKDGKPLMAYGLMGGGQQAQGHAQVLISMIDFGANAQAASDAARFSHSQGRDALQLETELFTGVGEQLEAMGHKVSATHGGPMGGFQAVTADPAGPAPGAAPGAPIEGVYRGASDHRKDGLAAGW